MQKLKNKEIGKIRKFRNPIVKKSEDLRILS